MLYSDTVYQKGTVMSKHHIENATLPFKELQARLEREQSYKENPIRALGTDLVESFAGGFYTHMLSKS